MSESYAVSEKRELLLDRVRKFILDNGGIVKKSQLAGLGIDYRRILDFVEKGDILRVKSGYYAVHLSDFTEEELVAKLFPDCVLNLENALYAYGYIKNGLDSGLFATMDGLHYDYYTSKAIYEFMVEQVTNP